MLSKETDSLKQGLRKNKHKLTRPRQTVMDVLAIAEHRLTPGEIYEKAKVRDPRIGLTTVYRTLDLLVDLGYIQRIHLEKGCHSYAPAVQRHGHQIVCSNCGRIQEFEGCDLDPLIKTLQSKTGYTINIHMLELLGLCPDCQRIHLARKGRGETKRGL